MDKQAPQAILLIYNTFMVTPPRRGYFICPLIIPVCVCSLCLLVRQCGIEADTQKVTFEWRHSSFIFSLCVCGEFSVHSIWVDLTALAWLLCCILEPVLSYISVFLYLISL